MNEQAQTEQKDLFLKDVINGNTLTTEFQGYVQTITNEHLPLWTTYLLAKDREPARLDHSTEEQAVRIHNQIKSDLSKMN